MYILNKIDKPGHFFPLGFSPRPNQAFSAYFFFLFLFIFFQTIKHQGRLSTTIQLGTRREHQQNKAKAMSLQAKNSLQGVTPYALAEAYSNATRRQGQSSFHVKHCYPWTQHCQCPGTDTEIGLGECSGICGTK